MLGPPAYRPQAPARQTRSRAAVRSGPAQPQVAVLQSAPAQLGVLTGEGQEAEDQPVPLQVLPDQVRPLQVRPDQVRPAQLEVSVA